MIVRNRFFRTVFHLEAGFAGRRYIHTISSSISGDVSVRPEPTFSLWVDGIDFPITTRCYEIFGYFDLILRRSTTAIDHRADISFSVVHLPTALKGHLHFVDAFPTSLTKSFSKRWHGRFEQHFCREAEVYIALPVGR
jgi:hypothetical protein